MEVKSLPCFSVVHYNKVTVERVQINGKSKKESEEYPIMGWLNKEEAAAMGLWEDTVIFMA